MADITLDDLFNAIISRESDGTSSTKLNKPGIQGALGKEQIIEPTFNRFIGNIFI